MLKFKKDQPAELEDDGFQTVFDVEPPSTQDRYRQTLAFQKQQDNTINRLAKRILGLEEANRGLRKYARRLKRKLEKADKRGETLSAQRISHKEFTALTQGYEKADKERNEASAAYVKMKAERDSLLSLNNDLDARVRRLEGNVRSLQEVIWWQNGGKKEYKKEYSAEAYKRRKEDIEDEIACAVTNHDYGMDVL